MEEENRTYTYTYSARQHEEVDNIRKKYLPKEEDKMEQPAGWTKKLRNVAK